MNVVVLGAGIIGVCTAYFLRRAGHEVSVIDRAAAAAEETSFANAGQLSYGYTTPWAAPGIPLKAAKWLTRPHSPLILRPDGSAFQIRWLRQMLTNCTEARYKENKARMVRISEYSRSVFRQLAADTGIAFEGRQAGTLQVFRTDKEVAAAKKDMAVLAAYGVPFSELSAAECLQYEPGLAASVNKLAGALHLPNDATGDCALFAKRLADLCARDGVRFFFNHAIESFDSEARRITAVYAGGKRFEADRFVCALGSFSRPALAQLDIDLPVYPVKGYSITVPLDQESSAPQSTVLDETYKVAITRFDRRIRVGGMAELSGYALSLNPARRATLERVLNDLFPGGGRTAESSFWSGLRPMTPDSTPLIGRCGWDNLILNTGHGTLGWTMSAGSGKLAADLVSDTVPEIETGDLGLSRYR
ncbi:D-amino acid dehydrogenase [Neisseria leonii]|uniref:D-amino acid dehydrogenase n=1 Tax=Neisseria leonii TaxID=2995413 RepID=UPI00237BDFA1|nr:D-amino acid dehydrogenase [Neisseria sp. 3986]MDD9326426.1 D-amino acid dehydrogenase [Neisseria sp. 3986]